MNAAPESPAGLQSQPLFDIQMSLHPIQELGNTPMGLRRIVPVAGGTFEGPRLRGVVLPHAGRMNARNADHAAAWL